MKSFVPVEDRLGWVAFATCAVWGLPAGEAGLEFGDMGILISDF